MLVAHIGNIAQNAYINTMLQRDYINSHCFDYGGLHDLSFHPGWCDIYMSGDKLPEQFLDWDALEYKRPFWAKILGFNNLQPWYSTQEDFNNDWAQHKQEIISVYQSGELPRLEPVKAIAKAFDLVVLYGPEAIYGSFLDTPYITVEFSTMRGIHKKKDKHSILLQKGYQQAAWNIITNADCQGSAEQLGLQNYSFIPHPFDDTLFTSGRPRKKWIDSKGLVFFLASRAKDTIKGTHKAVRAFKSYIDTTPDATLLISYRGDGMDDLVSLLRKLELDDHIGFMHSQPKRVLRDIYCSVDVVLDQFSAIGSFGTTVVEGLACEKPVVSHIDPGVHAWCKDVLPELPPVCQAFTEEEIYQQLVSLGKSKGDRKKYGKKGKDWIKKWHSSQRTTDLNLNLYKRVLKVRN